MKLRCEHRDEGHPHGSGALLAYDVGGSRVWVCEQRREGWVDDLPLGYQWIDQAGEIDLLDELGHFVTVGCRRCGRLCLVGWDNVRRSIFLQYC